MFDRLDTNHDGTTSQSEAEASPDPMVIFVETDGNGDAVRSVSEFSSIALISDVQLQQVEPLARAPVACSGYYSAATQRNPAGADGPRYCCSLLKLTCLLPSGAGVRVADSTANFDGAVALCDCVLPRKQLVLTPSRFASGGIKLFAASNLNHAHAYHAHEEIRKP